MSGVDCLLGNTSEPPAVFMISSSAVCICVQVVGFVPTGWLHEMNKAARKGTFPSRTKGSCTVWLIPYSEHSSFVELKEYVAWLKPQQVCTDAGCQLHLFIYCLYGRLLLFRTYLPVLLGRSGCVVVIHC